jgi:molybdenum cofactor cytidylyltransferase
MGQDKAALPWIDDSLLLPWLVKTLREAGWEPVAVVGPHTEPFWRDRLPDAVLRLNPHPECGKTTSIAAGLLALPDEPGPILITAIDQPRPPELYRMLAAPSEGNAILVPDNRGHRGHPIVFPGRFHSQLAALEENSFGLRGFLDRHRAETSYFSCPTDWLRWDFNTPGAYEEALAWFRNRQIAP